MQRSTLIVFFTAVIAGALASGASAQALHGTWMRLNVKGTGLRVDLADDSVRKRGLFRGRCYMYVEYDAASNVYTGKTACEIGKKIYAETSGGPTFSLFSDGGGHASNAYAHYTNRGGQTIEGNGTHLLTPIFNRRGVLKKVRLSSYGELNGNSSLEPGVSQFLGGYQVAGVSVLERTVPDDVVAALTGGPVAGPPPATGVASQILGIVNGHRAVGATCGGTARPPVAPLSLHSALNAAADRHALDMATNDFFDHQGSDGSSPFDRIDDAGYPGGTQGENIAAGYTTPASVVNGWMLSSGHCNNIMRASYTHLGAAYAFNASATYGHYWVQTFGGS